MDSKLLDNDYEVITCSAKVQIKRSIIKELTLIFRTQAPRQGRPHPCDFIGWTDDTPIISLTECKRFIVDCMEAVGVSTTHAQALSDLLVEADYRGHYSHGMNRLERYLKEITTGWTNGSAVPKILSETPATAWVDGQNGLGAVVGKFCMELAIEKAKGVGIGCVCAKGSNHYGIAGMYAIQASKMGLLGLSFTNTSPIMNTTRSTKPAIGVNPLSLAAPAENNDNFVLDMSTTVVAVGKIEMHKRKNEAIPEGWALDREGKGTVDADVAYDAQHLMPLGGSEANGGYKGFGLGMLVELFTGVLSGANYGYHVPNWDVSSNVPRNLGQCFIAIDPNCFAPNFETRLSDLLNTIRSMEPVDPEKPVMVAGDPERLHMDEIDRAGGVRYCKDQMNSCLKLATALRVVPLGSTLQNKK